MKYLPPHRIFVQEDMQRVALRAVHIAMESFGKALPCRVTAVSGQIVTVAFELPQGAPWVLPEITIPKAEGPWINSPTQIGDVGMTVPANVYLGGISGIGGGAATWRRPGNLDALVWIPVAMKSTSTPNQNAALVQGPEGAIIQTEDGSAVLTINSSGMTFTLGGKTWSFTNAGFTMSTGSVAETHIHDDPQGGVTSGPVAG